MSAALPRFNVLDRIIGYFAPIQAYQRYRARMAQHLGEAYIGASTSRRSLAAWRAHKGSADADTLFDLAELRYRSEDLVRNAPIAAGAINTVATRVVGTGLALQSRIHREVLRLSEDDAAAWQRRTEMEFNLWAESTDADLSRCDNFYGLQECVLRSTLIRGDVFVVFPHKLRPGNPYGLKIQLIEADRVVNPRYQQDTPELAGGVEMDQDGAPIAYHILKQHPHGIGRSAQEWERIPAFTPSGRRSVQHVFKRTRPGLTRGVPYLAPIIEPMKQINRYTEAEIAAAVVASLFAVFIKSSGEGLSPLESAVTGNAPSGVSDPQKPWTGELSSGLVADLPDGADITTANPMRPNIAYADFTRFIFEQIGVALELPFEILMKHYTSSYSAARAALLEAWAFFKVRRDWMATHFCQPTYELWMEEAVALGRIAAPGFLEDPLIRMAWLGSQWVGDGPGAIDPQKEIDAARNRIIVGVSTLAEETMLWDGGNWELKHAQRVRERNMRVSANLETENNAAP